MSYSGEAAEQVVRMSLEGTEMAVKLVGTGAKELAVLLYAILKDQKKTKGKTRLSNMLRSGKELKVFAVKDDELPKFSKEAGKYGVLYTIIKDRNKQDGYTDVFVRAEDASKVNRIFERFSFATVDMGSVKTDIEKGKAEKTEKTESEKTAAGEIGTGKKEQETVAGEDISPGVVPLSEKDKVDEFLDALLGSNETTEAEHTGNPTEDRMKESRQSGPLSGKRPGSERDDYEKTASRPSVREEMKNIREEIDKKEVSKEAPGKTREHIAPRKKKRMKEIRA